MTQATTVHDPICHMDIEPATAAGISEYEGTKYYFCSGGCKRDFDNDPAGSLQAEASYDHSQPVHMMMMEEEAPDAHVHMQRHGSDAGAKKPWWKFWG